MDSKNIVETGGVQGANIVNSTVNKSTINIHQHDPQIDISIFFAQYKAWVVSEKENSHIGKKLKQLFINGDFCYIKRTLRITGDEFSADELLNRIPQSTTSLVTGPAGSGKSTLAASITLDWAQASESKYDLVLFLSSLHKMDKLPLHKQLWGEFAGHIREKDSLKIYEKLLEMKDKILIILDGIGNLFVQLIEDDDLFIFSR